MIPSYEVIIRDGQILPLDPFIPEEGERYVMVKMPDLNIDTEQRYRNLDNDIGSMRDVLSSVDEFLKNKHEEKKLEL